VGERRLRVLVGQLVRCHDHDQREEGVMFMWTVVLGGCVGLLVGLALALLLGLGGDESDALVTFGGAGLVIGLGGGAVAADFRR
jgi:hypothetical protein